MPYLARQLQDAIRKIVREEIKQHAYIDRGDFSIHFKGELDGDWDLNEVRFLRESRMQDFIDKIESKATVRKPESFVDAVKPWDFNFWFDRDSWGHRCHPNGRTVELRIDRSECPSCGVERPDRAPERRDESFYRSEFEAAVGYVDSRTWERLVNYVRGGGMEWTQARPSTDD